MSVDIGSVISWIGDVAPVTFVIAALGGVVGSLVSGLYFKRSLESRYIILELERLIQELKANADGEVQNSQEAYRAFIESLRQEQNKQASSSIALAKLGEYLSNHSPSDSLTKGVGR